MILFIECIAACVLFTVMVKLMTSKKQEVFANDYPPVVTDRLRKKGLIAEKPPARKSDVIRKLIAVVVYTVLFALLLRYVNGITNFVPAALTAYVLWLVVDWYDFLVIDVMLAPFDKFYQAANVSAYDKSAVWFHFKGSLIGMLIGLAFAPLVGLIVTLL